MPIPLREKVRVELQRIEDLGVISKIDQPTYPIVCWHGGGVQKVRGGAYLSRFKATKIEKWIFSSAIGKTLAQLTGAAVYSKLDANSGFWQIPLATTSRSLWQLHQGI